jgi:DNA polymerase III delta prime subunit
MLTDKYQPTTLNDIKLDDKALDSIIAWINSWNRGLPSQEKPALLLTGFPGTGKTTAAHCICNDAEWNLIEINASDSRRKEDLSEFTPEKNTILGERNCILFDEVDSLGIDGKSGEPYIKRFINEKQIPIILTANNTFKVPKEIKALCEVLQVYRPSVNALKVFLYEICKKEGLSPSNEVLEAASLSQDYRMGLNMIENNIVLSKNLTNVSTENIIRSLLLNVDVAIEDPKQLLYHLDANCSHLYNPFDLYKTYEILARVDILRRRGQIKQAATLLKIIPKTSSQEIELIDPVYIERRKGKTT